MGVLMLVLISIALFGCASAPPASIAPAAIETFADTDTGSKLVLHLSTTTVRVVETGDGPGFLAAVVIADADSATPLFMGVKAKDCAKPIGTGRPMYAFADPQATQVAGVTAWGNDPNSVWTKVGQRICALGAKVK